MKGLPSDGRGELVLSAELIDGVGWVQPVRRAGNRVVRERADPEVYAVLIFDGVGEMCRWWWCRDCDGGGGGVGGRGRGRGSGGGPGGSSLRLRLLLGLRFLPFLGHFPSVGDVLVVCGVWRVGVDVDGGVDVGVRLCARECACVRAHHWHVRT